MPVQSFNPLIGIHVLHAAPIRSRAASSTCFNPLIGIHVLHAYTSSEPTLTVNLFQSPDRDSRASRQGAADHVGGILEVSIP